MTLIFDVASTYNQMSNLTYFNGFSEKIFAVVLKIKMKILSFFFRRREEHLELHFILQTDSGKNKQTKNNQTQTYLFQLYLGSL
jgi:hypothetical protein